jgi:hypothetical protein
MTACPATYPHPTDTDGAYLHSCRLDQDHDDGLHSCPCGVRWIEP